MCDDCGLCSAIASLARVPQCDVSYLTRCSAGTPGAGRQHACLPFIWLRHGLCRFEPVTRIGVLHMSS